MTAESPSQTPRPADPAEPVHPIVNLTDDDLSAVLSRAVRVTAILGGVLALILWIATGWRNAAMLAIGAAISAASIYEWQRLIRLFNTRLDSGKTPRGAGLVIVLFLSRLVIFAAVIYGSLKGLQGSPIVLACGLSLAVAGLVWEALRLLRG